MAKFNTTHQTLQKSIKIAVIVYISIKEIYLSCGSLKLLNLLQFPLLFHAEFFKNQICEDLCKIQNGQQDGSQNTKVAIF